MTLPICTGITKAGKRCQARALPGSAYCVAHSPDVSDEQRRAWRAKGGAHSAKKIRARKNLPGEILTSDELAAWLSIVFRKLIVGQIDPPIATAAANLARTMTEINRAAEVQARIDELEAALGIAKIGRAS